MKTPDLLRHTQRAKMITRYYHKVHLCANFFLTHNPWACPWTYPSSYCQGSWIQLDIIRCWICQHEKEGTYLCEFSNADEVELCSNNMPNTTQALSLSCRPTPWEVIIIQICWQKHSRSVTRISTRFTQYYYGIILVLQHYYHAWKSQTYVCYGDVTQPADKIERCCWRQSARHPEVTWHTSISANVTTLFCDV